MTNASSPSSPAAASCPKCGQSGRAGEAACARCGLTFALWTPDKAAEVVQLDGKAETLWAELAAAWDDEARHDAFLKYCSVAGQLAPAGRRYRERLAEAPGDPLAIRMQDRIVAMATVSFTHHRAPPPPVTRNTWFWAVMVLCGVAGLASALLLGAR